MRITKLLVEDLRVIRSLELSPGPGVNFIVGGNGAGKTSILEAVYLAGRGRTFRHASAGPMIRRGSEATTVLVRLREGSDGPEHKVGLRRERSTFICRLDGEPVRKRSVLADALPLQWVGSQPQRFLEMGPDWRRRFVDMGLFHVEHGYLSVYAETVRTLRQRNAALKHGNPAGVSAWDAPFAAAAEELDRFRSAYVRKLVAMAAKILERWQAGFVTETRYRHGWRADESLRSALERKMAADLRHGHTSVGPQRAEIEFLVGGQLAERTLSRGQQKTLMMALNLAMVDLMLEKRRRRPVVLIDDLGAELDRSNQEKVIGALCERRVQAVIAAIEEPEVPVGAETVVFHVEHGSLI